MNRTELSKLAMNGGPKTRTQPFPGRSLIGPEEKAAVNALFDKAISTGEAFGYNGVEEGVLQRVCRIYGWRICRCG